MKVTSRELLEKYVKGKDEDLYQILEDIYSDDAEVYFEIASDKISFPEKINGSRAISQVLSRDFNLKYRDVKTYYLAQPADDQENIYTQQWLVVMRDEQSEATRVGTGYYDWEFSSSSNGFKIKKHKIYIHDMLSFTDPRKTELERIQGLLRYPWGKREQVCEVLSANEIFTEITKYIAEV